MVFQIQMLCFIDKERFYFGGIRILTGYALKVSDIFSGCSFDIGYIGVGV